MWATYKRNRLGIGLVIKEMELWNFETERWDDIENLLKSKLEMFEAEMNFKDAAKALEKAEKELYLSVFWADYAKEHKN